ncbi:expressed unknown protein [Seminavis robusta]|uniref:Transmembrane protein n=1 Tax=Seminavis robusta TaxID=568900 RepID=A0A9N8DUD2_9STRA|nr:expressed unknown protein [Seminavis robusta]|eukprot:Sro282_g107510.1 n/a (539) ;mRNA; f:40524-42246
MTSLWTQVFHDEDTLTEGDSVEENLLRLEQDLRQLSPSVVAATEETMEKIDEAIHDIGDLRMGTLIIPDEDLVEDDDDDTEEEEKALIRDHHQPADEIRAWTPFWCNNGGVAPEPEEEREEAEAAAAATEEEAPRLEEDSTEGDGEPTRTLGARFKELMVGFVTILGNCVGAIVNGICYCCNQIKAGVSYSCSFVLAAVLASWNNTLMFFRSLKGHIEEGVTSTQTSAREWTHQAKESLFVPSQTMLQALCGGLFLGMVAAILMGHRTPQVPSPKEDLREFVTFEKAHNVVDLKQIEDLNTEAFRTYARSTCVDAATFEQAHEALSMGLYGVPDSVRNDVVRMAIIEGVTQKNSVQDSNSDFVSQGKAEAYMAFWSTVFNPHDKQQAYKTCVMVTGVALTVAETIAEWTTKEERYQIGIEPCHCGYLYCEECPVFDTRQVQWPIFERRSLSLQKQEELRRWMVDRAIQSAEHLLLGGGASNRALGNGTDGKAWNPVKSMTWSGESNRAFFGQESHVHDRPPKRTVYPKTKAEDVKQDL